MSVAAYLGFAKPKPRQDADFTEFMTAIAPNGPG